MGTFVIGWLHRIPTKLFEFAAGWVKLSHARREIVVADIRGRSLIVAECIGAVRVGRAENPRGCA
jgi:hypothetical protein